MTSPWRRLPLKLLIFLLLTVIILIVLILMKTEQSFLTETNSVTHESEIVFNETTSNGNDEKPESHSNIYPEENDKISIEEFVIPQKIVNEDLHPDDLLYESSKYAHQPTLHHQSTGQFRDITSLVWDPFPQYIISAFGMHLHLILYQDNHFLSQNLKITQIWYDDLVETEQNSDEYQKTKGCFYKGIVQGLIHSRVTVSLCGGMSGHIYTSNSSFLIYPVEKYTMNHTNVLHRISRFNTIHGEGEGSTEAMWRPKRAKRNVVSFTTSNDYTMEVLIAVDSKMEEYHGENMKNYVLTLMSIVSSIYLDPTIGNAIKIAVVHILLIHDDVNIKDIQAGVSASYLLAKFCRLVQHNMFHHDTALLLTREQICRNSDELNCETLGLAELASVCKSSSCAIVQENGLSAAFTIAHELGHILSMPHDDDMKCSRFQTSGNTTQNIMSRMLDHNTHPWSWSPCSKYYVTDYLERNNGHCMRDKPILDMTESKTRVAKFAGEVFSPNHQCELVFGASSIVCSYMPPCGRLWCGNDIDGCRTQHMPWADGTPCGDGLWCQRGQCVLINREALVKIDGAWGPWSIFRECSRTCGGGIQSSTRECDSPLPANGGKYCIGNRIKYRSCNIQDCELKNMDYREEQCAALNNNNFGIVGLHAKISWIPKYGVHATDECKLFCRIENSTNYFLLREKVKDGTPCTRDSFNKCINGICWDAGCDHELGSSAKLDKCGICGGNNETCIDIQGVIDSQQIQQRYRATTFPTYIYVVTIPAGSSNLNIIQPGFPNDLIYIALADDNGTYILNGYNIISKNTRMFIYAGVTFEYSGTNSNIERVNSSYARQLKRDLIVEILSRSSNFNTTELLFYKYSTLVATTNSRNPHARSHNESTVMYSYEWRRTAWSMCTDECNGTKFRSSTCINIRNDDVVDDSYCLTTKPPDEHSACNQCDFTYAWHVSQWQKCPASCTTDVSRRDVQCMNMSSKSIQRVDDRYCTEEKPKDVRRCSQRECAIWAAGKWGRCNLDCIRKRSVFCRIGNTTVRVKEELCPPNLKPVDIEDCCTYKWRNIWSPCSVTCGFGIRQRRRICTRIHPSRKGGVKVGDYECMHINDAIVQPRTKTCKRICEEPNWVISPWSSCSVGCGLGYALREVRCMLSGRKLLKEHHCFKRRKPIKMKRCQNRYGCQWKVGPWRKCNCRGVRKRRVQCFDTKINKLSNGCLSPFKPHSKEQCSANRNCFKEQLMLQ